MREMQLAYVETGVYSLSCLSYGMMSFLELSGEKKWMLVMGIVNTILVSLMVGLSVKVILQESAPQRYYQVVLALKVASMGVQLMIAREQQSLNYLASVLVVMASIQHQGTTLGVFKLELEQHVFKLYLGYFLVVNNISTPAPQRRYNYIASFPVNLVLFSQLFFELLFVFLQVQSKKKVYFEKKSKDTFMEVKNSIKNAQPSSIHTPVMLGMKQASKGDLQEDAESMFESKEHNQLEKIASEDDHILESISWISNQQVVVYGENFEVAFQNFYLGKLLKAGVLLKDEDYSSILVESLVVSGSKELIEMFETDRVIEENYDLIGVQKFKLREKQQVKAVMNQMYRQYQKWRYGIIYLEMLRNHLLDMEGIHIKLFIQKIHDKKYIVLQFESRDQINISHDLTQSHLTNMLQTFLIETCNYVNCVLVLIIISQHHHNELKKYAHTIKLNTLKYQYFLNALRDQNFCLQNQLFLKIHQFKLTDIIDELFYVYEDIFRSRDASFLQLIDLPETLNVIFSDADRIKSVLASLLNISLKYSVGSQIKLEIKLYNTQGLIFSLKEQSLSQDPNLCSQIQELTRQMNSILRTQQEPSLDLTNHSELQISSILAWQLSGTIRRGLEFFMDNNGCSTFFFYVEIGQNDSKTIFNSGKDCGPIKVLGAKKYFETSLSLLLNQVESQSEDDKQLSFSKQFSIKPSDAPIDLQSAFFSHISRIRESSQSRNIANSNSNSQQQNRRSNSGLQFQDSILYQQSQTYQQKSMSKNLKRPSKETLNNDSISNRSHLDFGDSTLNCNEPPQMFPKLLTSVIKFKLTGPCCKKVLLVDNDHYNLLVLQFILQKYGIQCDKATNGKQALELIGRKRETPCHCGNSSYLIYFMEIALPLLGGIDLIRKIKQEMAAQTIDRGFTIAITTYIDLNTKLECFRNGMDYFIGKPIDLLELSAIIQYVNF